MSKGPQAPHGGEANSSSKVKIEWGRVESGLVVTYI